MSIRKILTKIGGFRNLNISPLGDLRKSANNNFPNNNKLRRIQKFRDIFIPLFLIIRQGIF